MTYASRSTPWGRSDGPGDLVGTEGIRFYSTPSHGGYFVPRRLVGRVPMTVRARCAIIRMDGDWYEEDCAAAVVAHVFGFSEDAAGSVVAWYGPDVARLIGIDPSRFQKSLDFYNGHLNARGER